MPLELKTLPIDQLIPAPYNPRVPLRPGSRRHRNLTRSLREFGLIEPIVWNELTGHVVGGHQRLEILRAEGMTEIPVSVVRLSPEREKALNIVLNNLEAQSRYNPRQLEGLLTELADLPEMAMTGFTLGDLADLRLDPVDPLIEPPKPRVEVTLDLDPATFERINGELDELIRRFDIHCRVQRF